MGRTPFWFVLAALVTLPACSEDPVVARSRKVLPDIVTRLASDTPDDAQVMCSIAYGPKKRARVKDNDAQLAAELERLCLHDMPVRIIEAAATKAEAARAKANEGAILSECYAPFVSESRETLSAKGPLEPKVEALLAKYQQACPRAKV